MIKLISPTEMIRIADQYKTLAEIEKKEQARDELKPCHYCGGDAFLVERYHGPERHCSRCGMVVFSS